MQRKERCKEGLAPALRGSDRQSWHYGIARGNCQEFRSGTSALQEKSRKPETTEEQATALRDLVVAPAWKEKVSRVCRYR